MIVSTNDLIIKKSTDLAIGIGRQMTSALLLRPFTTVIATARDITHSTSQSLSSLPTHSESRLILLPFDAADISPSPPLADILAGSGVPGIDVVISNAGASSGGFDEDTLTVEPLSLRTDFEVNAIAPIRLFQAAWPLLAKRVTETGEAKFVLITSSLGSIAIMDEEPMPGVSYGASKAAANWLSKKISVEMKGKGLKVGIIHPG